MVVLVGKVWRGNRPHAGAPAGPAGWLLGMGRSKKANDNFLYAPLDVFLCIFFYYPFDTPTSQACWCLSQSQVVSKRKPNIGLDSEDGRRLLAALGSRSGIFQWAEIESGPRQVLVSVLDKEAREPRNGTLL